MPMIIMPTRITTRSATTIDHILYFEGHNCNKNHKLISGNLWSHLTDHLPNYSLIFNSALHHNRASDRPFVRLYS